MFNTACPHCSARFELDEPLRGQRLRCGACGREFAAQDMHRPATFIETRGPRRRRSSNPLPWIIGTLGVLIVGLPLVACGGCFLLFGKAVDVVSDEISIPPRVARSLLKRSGYVNVQLRENPESHPLGYMVDASGADSQGREHKLFLVFRRRGEQGELIYLSEDGDEKLRTKAWDDWLPKGEAQFKRAMQEFEERMKKTRESRRS